MSLPGVANSLGPSRRTINFSGYKWSVKASRVPIAPGPNRFSSAKDAAFVDAAGRLHLRITGPLQQPRAVELIGSEPLGYGTYTWVIDSPVTDLDPNLVLGLFTWNDNPAFSNREIDIEYARWGNPRRRTNAQFLVQPDTGAGNLQRVSQPLSPHTVGFTWSPFRIDFFSPGAAPPTWSRARVVPPGGAHPRINLWLYRGRSPGDGHVTEVVLRSFSFTPAG